MKVVVFWEVLNGVGVDGVGVISPSFFTRIFPFFFTFFSLSSSLFFAFFSSSPKGQGQTTAKFTAKKGNFTPNPSAPTPCKTSRVLGAERGYFGGRGGGGGSANFILTGAGTSLRMKRALRFIQFASSGTKFLRFPRITARFPGQCHV